MSEEISKHNIQNLPPIIKSPYDLDSTIINSIEKQKAVNLVNRPHSDFDVRNQDDLLALDIQASQKKENKVIEKKAQPPVDNTSKTVKRKEQTFSERLKQVKKQYESQSYTTHIAYPNSNITKLK